MAPPTNPAHVAGGFRRASFAERFARWAFFTPWWAGARFGVRIDPATAGRFLCGQCTIECPMGIAVMEEHVMTPAAFVDDPHCTRCGECLDRCPGGVLDFGFRNASRSPDANVRTDQQPRSDPAMAEHE